MSHMEIVSNLIIENVQTILNLHVSTREVYLFILSCLPLHIDRPSGHLSTQDG